MQVVWVVREPDDHGEPIVAICATEADAETCAAGYRIAYPSSTPYVEEWELDRSWQEADEHGGAPQT